MIEVHIPRSMAAKLNDNEVLFGLHVLGKLRDAGIPAEGTLFVRGVTSGTLEVTTDDLASDDWIWRWTP